MCCIWNRKMASPRYLTNHLSQLKRFNIRLPFGQNASLRLLPSENKLYVTDKVLHATDRTLQQKLKGSSLLDDKVVYHNSPRLAPCMVIPVDKNLVMVKKDQIFQWGTLERTSLQCKLWCVLLQDESVPELLPGSSNFTVREQHPNTGALDLISDLFVIDAKNTGIQIISEAQDSL